MARKAKSQTEKTKIVSSFSADAAQVNQLIAELSVKAVEESRAYNPEEYAEKLIKTASIANLK